LKEIARHRPGFEPFRFAGAGEVKISWNTEGSGELLEGHVLRAIIQIIDRRYADAIAAAPDVSPRPDQSVGLGKRQRLDQHGVDYAEDRHIGADAHTERQNGDQREARILEQHSRAVAHVLPDLFQEADATHISTFFLHPLNAAKATESRKPSLF